MSGLFMLRYSEISLKTTQSAQGSLRDKIPQTVIRAAALTHPCYIANPPAAGCRFFLPRLFGAAI